jgi:hypothetical protein
MTTPSAPSDTSRDAYEVQLELLRRLPPSERLRKSLAMSRLVRKLARDAIGRRFPGWDAPAVELKFIELTYGSPLADQISAQQRSRLGQKKGAVMDELEDLVDALAPVVRTLDGLGVRHFVGGSVASSFHGATRSTMDVDLVCELAQDAIEPLLAGLGTDYYVSEVAVREAVACKGCFNLIHLPTSFKVDVFVSRGRPFDLQSMQRATRERLGTSRSIDVPMATAEDSIISKLEWYQLGNQASERQWDDVSRLIDLQGEAIDREYLRRAATSVGVEELLNRLLSR